MYVWIFEEGSIWLLVHWQTSGPGIPDLIWIGEMSIFVDAVNLEESKKCFDSKDENQVQSEPTLLKDSILFGKKRSYVQNIVHTNATWKIRYECEYDDLRPKIFGISEDQPGTVQSFCRVVSKWWTVKQFSEDFWKPRRILQRSWTECCTSRTHYFF